MKNSPKFCNRYCKFLHPKEDEQAGDEPHVCAKYGTRVRHQGFGTQLVRLNECDEELDNEQFELEYSGFWEKAHTSG